VGTGRSAGYDDASTPALEPICVGSPRKPHPATDRPTSAGLPGARSTLREQARTVVEAALSRATASGALPRLPDDARTPVEVERPTNPDHGDFAANLALKLARPLRMAPREIAVALAAAMSTGPDEPIADVAVAGPGFLNLRLADSAIEALLDGARVAPDGWGRARETGDGRRVNVEFVSANPTGPLTVGNARGAFVGDLLCRVLEAGGQHVTREYYFNDSGAQVRNLGASVIAIRDGQPVPDDGYHGDYVVDLAPGLPEELLADATSRGDDPAWAAGRWASEQIRAGIEASLEALGVHFDVWTTEGSLHADGWVAGAVERLRAAGHLYEQDGALWFRSTAFGDDKDRVVIRANGEPTYFAADIGYVVEKFSRDFDHLIYIWGADHHGTVARVRNAAKAMGFDRSAVEMILTGWVRFVRDGVDVSMSKRAGTFITLDELLAEIGPDAARWFFGSRGANVNIDFDIELAKKQSNENPVYYVQYAHARIASILRKAAEAGLAAAPSLAGALAGAPEAGLARAAARYPEVVEDAAAAQETQSVTTYATELATAFHAFYRDARVVDPDEPGLSATRLALVDVTRITLANSLGLLGISAPDAM
jgi:arginyl-tRNA synthetase